MKKNVFLSIIVPIYNVEKYIGSLVNSLVKQTNK
ncbi:glycosyltransferase family 2 protein, partial [Lactococcus laudensis]|nr:glycosyltransferase family 2 protein [Lactococcus laudensis]